MPRADKVIGTIKVLQNGKAMIKALPSDREAVMSSLELVLWWLNANDRPDHQSAHRPLGFTVLDDGALQIGVDKPSQSVTIDVFDEIMVGITKEEVRRCDMGLPSPDSLSLSQAVAFVMQLCHCSKREAKQALQQAGLDARLVAAGMIPLSTHPNLEFVKHTLFEGANRLRLLIGAARFIGIPEKSAPIFQFQSLA